METQMAHTEKRRIKVPVRYVFAGVRVLMVLISSVQGGCMSLAITSMVKSSSSSATNTTNNATQISSDVCPAPLDTDNVTTAKDKGGDFEWSELTQSYITNGPTYGSLCTMMLGAYIAQRLSPKMIIAIVTSVSVLATLLTPVLANWNVYALIVSRILHGLVMGCGMPASGELESSWFPPEERQSLSGIIMSAIHVGSIVSSSLTGVLIEEYGWEFTFYLYGGLCSMSLLLWALFVYDTPQKHPRITEEEKEYIAARINKITDEKLPVPWLQMATSPPVWAYLTMSISITWLAFIFMTELPTYLKRMLHYSTSKAGYITSLAHAATVSSQIVCATVSQWLRRKGYISQLTSYRIFNAIATLGPAATVVAITQVGCDATAIVVLLLMTMLFHGSFISGSMLNHMDLAINFVPALVGLNGTIISVVGILSPTLTAAIINNNQTLTAWSTVFYMSAAVTAVPYVIFFFFGSVEEQSWNKPKTEISKKASKATAQESHRPEKERSVSIDHKVHIP
ncbi:sialin-like [Bacillus rossius redtenbacheri]|uniref:sialin-like n=1 Tax=Bacillus rossius redtenbacheri TaxID=93214 RepID=UPI002FDD989B